MVTQENTLTQQSKGAKYTDHRKVPYRAAIPKLTAANISNFLSVYVYYSFKRLLSC